MNRSSAHASPPLVLVYAASDPSGGAGIQADLLTCASIGCHPLSVITAVTVQDSVGVARVAAVDSQLVTEQASLLLQDMSVTVCKIGLLGSVENVATVAELLAAHPDIPVVFDPVLASGRGDVLADASMILAIRQYLLPLTTVLTPNTLEVRRLAAVQTSLLATPTLAECSLHLLDLGCKYVLLTGTHNDTPQVYNELYRQGYGLVRTDRWQRLAGSYHGSGCTLASAVASFLAQGYPVEAAVQAAQQFTWQSLATAFRPGKGQYLPNRFFKQRVDTGRNGCCEDG